MFRLSSTRGGRSGSSVPTAPARPPRSDCCRAFCRRPRGASLSAAWTWPPSRCAPSACWAICPRAFRRTASCASTSCCVIERRSKGCAGSGRAGALPRSSRRATWATCAAGWWGSCPKDFANAWGWPMRSWPSRACSSWTSLPTGSILASGKSCWRAWSSWPRAQPSCCRATSSTKCRRCAGASCCSTADAWWDRARSTSWPRRPFSSTLAGTAKSCARP